MEIKFNARFMRGDKVIVSSGGIKPNWHTVMVVICNSIEGVKYELAVSGNPVTGLFSEGSLLNYADAVSLQKTLCKIGEIKFLPYLSTDITDLIKVLDNLLEVYKSVKAKKQSVRKRIKKTR